MKSTTRAKQAMTSTQAAPAALLRCSQLIGFPLGNFSVVRFDFGNTFQTASDRVTVSVQLAPTRIFAELRSFETLRGQRLNPICQRVLRSLHLTFERSAR